MTGFWDNNWLTYGLTIAGAIYLGIALYTSYREYVLVGSNKQKDAQRSKEQADLIRQAIAQSELTAPRKNQPIREQHRRSATPSIKDFGLLDNRLSRETNKLVRDRVG